MNIRQSARGEECTLRLPGICNFDLETTVLAHLPSRLKGMGTKSADIHGVYACSCCHDAIDGRMRSGLSRDEIKAAMLDALIETQLRLIEKGLL